MPGFHKPPGETIHCPFSGRELPLNLPWRHRSLAKTPYCNCDIVIARTGLFIQACFSVSNALRASSVKDTHSAFLQAPSPARCSFRGWAILAKPSIMSYQAKKGPDLSVSLWRSVFCYGFHIDVAGSYACFGHLVSQIIYFLLE